MCGDFAINYWCLQQRLQLLDYRRQSHFSPFHTITINSEQDGQDRPSYLAQMTNSRPLLSTCFCAFLRMDQADIAKEYQCLDCSYSTDRKSNFDRHQKTHLNRPKPPRQSAFPLDRIKRLCKAIDPVSSHQVSDATLKLRFIRRSLYSCSPRP